MSEIDVQAKKNVDTALSSNWKKSEIKKHNIRAALKNEKKNRPDTWIGKKLGYSHTGSTKKSKSLSKEMGKVHKTQKAIDRVWDRIDKHGDKYAGYAVQKDHLKKMGVYRDKKGGQVLEAPKGGWTQTETAAWKKRQKERQKKQGGGIALRGLGRAFLKGGKV